MPALPSLEGVVVGTVDFGETNRIVRLLSAAEGRVDLVVYRARTRSGRWPALLQVGNQLRVERGRGRGKLPIARSADRLGGPRRAREDIDRIGLLAYGCELCGALAPVAHPAPKLAGLLEAWLQRLEVDPAPGDAARVALETKALTFAGVCPALVRCARCGDPLDDPAVFDPEAGGAMHGRCGLGREVSVDALIRFEALRRTPLREIGGEGLEETSWVIADFVEHQLGKRLRSRGVMEQLQRPEV